MLQHFKVTPYLVFDGDYLPSKAATESERAQRRDEAKKRGLDLLKLGKNADAYSELQKAVDITPEMARLLIEELKKARVQYIVAPYEADSQMAYLEKKGIVNGILSEDSDLLVFGARVLVTKLDQYGECVVVRRDDFTACREVSLVGWTDADFRRMAILSGCDYLTNIPKFGLKTAHRYLRTHKKVDRIVRALQFDGQYTVPKDYLQNFEQAERTFLHQWVYCPTAKGLVNCTALPDHITAESLEYLGPYVEPDIATATAMGDLNPHTKLPIQIMPMPSQPFSTVRGKENIAQTPDLKKTPSIESFFKPKRTPLAELDPNLFTPSPHQQQTLERHRNSGPWSASPAPNTMTRQSVRSTVFRSNMSTSSTPVSNPIRRAKSTPHKTGAVSNPLKRQRLCSDASLAHSPSGGPGTAADERSKFFVSPKRSKSSPVQRSPRQTEASARGSANLWSDDSIEDALASLPDPSSVQDSLEFSLFGSRKSKKRDVSIFEDGAHGLDAGSKRVQDEESQTSASTVTRAGNLGSQNSATGDSADTQASSVDSETQNTGRGPDDGIEHPGVQTSATEIISKFSYTAKSSFHTDPESIELQDDEVRGTPLPDTKETHVADQQSFEDATVVPGSSPLRASGIVPDESSKVLPQYISTAKGSEDVLLVPNSEDESGCLSEDESTPTKHSTVDFQKFAFTG